jgi:hypothetical protein
MNRDQAAEIHEYLFDAARELDCARAAIFTLSKDDRETLAAPLDTVLSALHFELLQAIYDRYPELNTFGEFPAITSLLRWDEVCLPPSVSEADIDSIIFSVMKPQWQKTAMVVVMASKVMASKRCEELALPISGEALAACIQVLAESGRIEGAGDLRKWRHSEVRLNR